MKRGILIAALAAGVLVSAARADMGAIQDACDNETSLFCSGLKGAKLLQCLKRHQEVALPQCRKTLEESGQVKKAAPAAAKVPLAVAKSTATAAEVKKSTQAPAGKIVVPPPPAPKSSGK